jgi:hypothetical protein
MVIAGLLVIALVCLVLGLLMQSSVWLVASLIATAGAGFLLFKLRTILAAPRPPARATHSDGEDPDGQAAVSVASSSLPASAPNPAEVWVIDGRPRYHLGSCAIIKGQDAEAIPYAQATGDGFMACSLCEPHAARAR